MGDPRAPLRYHWLRLRASCHPTEDREAVLAALRFASGLADAPFAAALEDRALETHHGLPLHVFEVTLDRARAVRDVLARVLALPGARARLAATLAQRVDDDGVFYARLDKQAAAAGQLALLDGEDAIQLRLRMEAYPAGREASLGALEAMLASERP